VILWVVLIIRGSVNAVAQAVRSRTPFASPDMSLSPQRKTTRTITDGLSLSGLAAGRFFRTTV